MPWFEILSIGALCGLAWLWYDSIGARDACVAAARHSCLREGYQLLDDTVANASLRLARDEDGRLVLQRRYNFEYSVSGMERRPGSATLLGREVIAVDMGLRLVHSDTSH